MGCGDGGGGDAEHDSSGRDRGAIEEDANEESESDECAGKEDAEGRSGVEEDKGGADCEGKYKPPCDLVEGSVYVFEGVIAEAGRRRMG